MFVERLQQPRAQQIEGGMGGVAAACRDDEVALERRLVDRDAAQAAPQIV
jgi:hypothetical protein